MGLPCASKKQPLAALVKVFFIAILILIEAALTRNPNPSDYFQRPFKLRQHRPEWKNVASLTRMSVIVDVCKPLDCLSGAGDEYEILDAILGRAVRPFVGHVEFNALRGN